MRSARLQTLRSEPENEAVLPFTAAEAPDERGAPRREGVEVEVRPVGRSDELRRGDVPRAHEVVDLVVALVEPADLLEPPHDVAAPVGPRHADVLAHGDGHLAPGAQQLVGELQARGRGADDEHRGPRRSWSGRL